MSLGVLISLIIIGLLVFVVYIFLLSKDKNKIKHSDDDNYQDKSLIEQSQELTLIQKAKKVDTSISKNEIFKQAYERNNSSKKVINIQTKEEELVIPEISENTEEELVIPEILENTEEELVIPEITSETQRKPELNHNYSKIIIQTEEELIIPEISENTKDKNKNVDKFKEYSPEAIHIIERLSQQIKSINT